MREWMRDRMRRRGKRGPNVSESTGKIGQELPQNQPAPLQPNYADVEYGRRHDETQPGTENPVVGADLERAGRESNAAADGAALSRKEAEQQAGAPRLDHRSEPQHLEHQQGEPRQAEAQFASAGVTEFPQSEAPGAGPGKLVVETQPESPSQPPAEPSGGQRASRGFVVLAIGLPGSGKTTWFKRRGVTPLSSDMLRSILFDDITEQRYQGLVFSTLRSLLRARLIAKMPWNYVDATNLSSHERRQWIKMARSFGYDVQAVFFDVPFAVCMERNRRRERTVNEETMQKMAERLRPPSFKEGFSKITVVRVKGQPAPTPESAMNAPVPPDSAGDEPEDDLGDAPEV
jgi:predicted kinase